MFMNLCIYLNLITFFNLLGFVHVQPYRNTDTYTRIRARIYLQYSLETYVHVHTYSLKESTDQSQSEQGRREVPAKLSM